MATAKQQRSSSTRVKGGSGGGSKPRHPARQTDDAPTLTGRFKFLRQAGLQYKGVRDIYAAAGYVQEGAENFDHYWSLYERDPVAGRVVDMPAKTSWRTPPEVFEGDRPADIERTLTDFEQSWNKLATRLRVWRAFERVDRLARVGRYAVLLIGARGGDDRGLAEPLAALSRPEDVLYLVPFAEKYAAIETWEKDPSNARFGLPLTYQIELSSGSVSGFPAMKARVHHTRVIHVAEDALVDEVFGRPALKRALNPLADLLKVSASTGEAYWQIAARILTAKLDPTMDLGENPTTALKNMGEDLEALVHDLRRQFVGHGVELGWLSTEVPTPGEALEVYKALIAVATGIPTRVLFGSERGELASSQDERNYFGMINERQEHFAEPTILRPFIDRLVTAGALPQPKAGAGEYTVLWPNLFEMTEAEMAEANKLRAEAAKALTPMGGDPMMLVEVDEDRNVWLLATEPLEQRVLGGGGKPAGAGDDADLEPGAGENDEDLEPPLDDEEEPV